MCNTVDFFTIQNHKPNAEQVIANNSPSLRIVLFKFNGISQWNEQSKEVISALTSLNPKRYIFDPLYMHTNVCIYK